MKLIVEISREIEEKIFKLVEGMSFRDFDHFIEVACRNQLIAEGGEISWKFDPTTSPVLTSSESTREHLVYQAHDLLKIPPPNVVTFVPPPDTLVAYSNRPLWGQLYRFLPLKVGVRVLANLCADVPVDIERFHESASEIAHRFRFHLMDLDRRNRSGVGEKLATSFPTGKRESIRRYITQFLLNARPTDGNHTGFMARMYFASINDDDGECFVCPTQAGLDFAGLPNPVLDVGNSSEPLSTEEVDFLLGHLSGSVKAEYEHLLAFLTLLRDGPMGGEELNAGLQGYYLGFQKKGSQWSDAMINTMRSGVTSRTIELGLASRKRPKRGSSLVLTSRGESWLDLQQKAK